MPRKTSDLIDERAAKYEFTESAYMYAYMYAYKYAYKHVGASFTWRMESAPIEQIGGHRPALKSHQTGITVYFMLFS